MREREKGDRQIDLSVMWPITVMSTVESVTGGSKESVRFHRTMLQQTLSAAALSLSAGHSL